MGDVLVGVILVVAIAFLAFLVVVTVLAIKNRQPGQSFIKAGKMTVISGWQAMKSRFIQTDVSPPGNQYMGPNAAYSGMEASGMEASGMEASGMEGVPATPDNSAVRAQVQAAHFTQGSTGAGAPGAPAYENFAKEALQEDLDAMAGQHRFGDTQLPAAPLTDDQFRYTGDFGAASGRAAGVRDPLLASPLVKTDIGFSNRGVGIW